MTSPLLAAVHRTSAALHATADAFTRAFLLAVDAARFGVAGFGVDGGAVRVRWSTGVQVTTRLLATLCGHGRALSCVVTTVSADGRPVAVSGGLAEPTVRVWDLLAGAQTAVLRPSEEDAWALAATVLDGRPTVVTGSFNGVIQTWDLAGGAPTGRVDAEPGDLVCSLATATLDGRPVLVYYLHTNDGDPDTYREWPEITVSDLTTGHTLHAIDTGHTGAVFVATAVLHGRPVIVSGGSTDTALRVWDLATGAEVGPVFAGHTGGSAAVTVVAVDGRSVLVAAGHGGPVRRWDLATGAPLGTPMAGLPAVHLAAASLAGRPAVVAASADAVCAWDASTGAVVVPRFVARGVGALAVSVAKGVPVAVTAMQDTTVRIWDLTPTAPTAVPPAPEPGVPPALTSGVSPAPVPDLPPGSGADPHAGSLQDAGSVPPAGHAGAPVVSANGHRGVVAAIAVAPLAAAGVVAGEAGAASGPQVVVSVGRDRTVHQWDLAARTAGAAHLGEVSVDLTDVAVSAAGGRVRFVGVGGTDVWCWEPGSAPALLASIPGRRLWSVATTVLDGRPVAVVGGDDGAWGGELRVVALPPTVAMATGGDALPWVGDVLGGHRSFVTSVATATVGGRAVAVAAGLTEPITRVWDLSTGQQARLDGPGGWIRAVATVAFAGQVHAVTGDVDGVLRQWNLHTCTQPGPPLTGHTGAVNAVATWVSDGRWPVAVTGGEDRTVRLWDLTTGEQIGREWLLPEPVTAVAATAGSVVVGFGFEVAVVDTPVLNRGTSQPPPAR